MGFPMEPAENNSGQESQITPDTGQDNSQGSQETINPAWNDVLKLVPETLHSQITPHFRNWDKGVQQRFQEIRNQYQPYEQYKPFLESQVSPDDLRMGYGLLQAVYQKPQEVIQAIQQTFGLTQEQAEDLVEQATENDNDPYANIPPQFMEEFMRMKQQTELQGKILLERRNQEIQEQQNRQLDNTLSELKSKYGDFPDEWVLSRALQLNNNIEAAVQEYHSLIEKELAARNRPKPPVLLGQNSGPIPENSVDPRKLTDRDTKNLVAEMLKRAAESQ